MDLRQLRYFATVARLGSFTAASRELRVSQPALGYKIKQLEGELGATLLTRHSRGAVVTEAGRALQRHADRILAELERAESAVRQFADRPTGRIVLGVTPTTGKELAPALVERVSSSTAIELSLRQGMSHELFADVASGQLDMAFCFDPPEHAALDRVELYRERLYLVGAPAVVATSRAIAFDDLAGIPLILDSRYAVLRGLIEEIAMARKIKLSVSLEVEPIELKRALMVRNRLCTIVPFGLFRDEIESGALFGRRIVKPPLRRHLHLVWRRGLNPILTAAIQDHAVRTVKERMDDRTMGWEPVAARP
jgi:LysR family nitrogen assimilation transcriptional regulator